MHTQNYMGVDLAYDADKMLWNIWGRAADGTTMKNVVTEEARATARQTDLLQQQVRAMQEEMAKIKAHSIAPNPMMVYGSKVYHSDFLKPGQVMSVSGGGGGGGYYGGPGAVGASGSSGASSNTLTREYIMAKATEDLMRGQLVKLEAPKAPEPVKPKPLSSARPDAKRWKYANL